ncbi:ATP synthase F1 subunit epsilon [Aestuariispira insulae]|uniref:ATP synthase epsilon chain n=1 Tax=Aestuariispira insulae TaxID=1461337 RepID=A0A3D9HHX4_9PROT|nr:ATP synthase F1 subunit epsilon [Aestuariispira insulae]RED49097.1 ATP synthase F1 subcomplex epsilon subunit [Aestuariispira insulae]
MADTVALELVSPEKLLMSEEVELAILPGSEGDLGVQPGHSPVIATVRPGTIAVFKGNTVEKRIFVAGGFLEITPERCTVLAETAIAVEDIDQTAAKQEIADLQDDVKVAKDDAARAKAEAALAVAEAKLEAAVSPAYA